MMLNIKKSDFELLPTKFSIARLFATRLNSKEQNSNVTQEQVYEEIEEAHIRLFGHPPPFTSFDSFRHYFTKHQKDVYRKAQKRPKNAPILDKK